MTLLRGQAAADGAEEDENGQPKHGAENREGQGEAVQVETRLTPG